MAPPQRVRHNAKARGSQAGASHKRKKRVNTDGGDSNAIEVVPKSGQQKDEERRERMRQELEAQSTSKMTSKKRKRMESYINKKLKKEERVKVLAKLAASQSDLPTSLHLGSSATLGTGKIISHAERLDKNEDLAVRKAFDGGSGRRKRRRLDPSIHGDEDEDEDDSYPDSDSDAGEMEGVSQLEPAKSNFSNAPVKPTLGSALASSGPPRIIPRKAKAGVSRKLNAWNPSFYSAQKLTESESSFDSSDSANDSTGEDEVGEDDMDEKEVLGEDSASASGSDSDEGSDSSSDSDSDTDSAPAPKRSFKEWAQRQINISKGLAEPSSEPVQTDEPPKPPAQPINFIPKLSRPAPGQYPGPLGTSLQTPSTSLLPSSTNAPRITIDRSEEIQAARLELPILAEEQEIVETVLLNSVVILSGETGSGKTTQVPQFLYEAGFGVPGSDNSGMIGITQPRRVAAVSTASRVSYELNLPPPIVAHQVRYAKTTSPETRIKFMTDGVLLRELTGDLMLSRYSVVIVDEAHERGVNTDVLIGVLSRVVKLREKLWKEGKEGVKPLRLIIMSATLRLSDFAQNATLFSTPPPVISITTRQHPVTIHFDRRTRGDYVRAAETKVAKIHARLPPGGVLVFMTGQREIVELCEKLGKRFEPKKKKSRDEGKNKDRCMAAAEGVVESEEVELGTRKDEVNDGETSQVEEDPDALDSDEESQNEELQIDSEQSDVPMHIVPLYSLLPSDKQMKVFEPPPEGARLVVVATNVAETSLTIPGIRYVVDAGRAKERRFDSTSGLQSFDIAWISKASADQRSGRAGRTGPGHCYRLYSSALYESHFPPHTKPEIERMPVEGVVLQMKSMGIDAVINFPFPTPPEREALRRAEVTLAHLGALAGEGNVVVGGQITPLGRAMSLFPVSPRFSKMLVMGRQKGCLAYVITIAAALSVGDPFLREEAVGDGDEDEEEDESELAPEFKEIRSEELRAKEIRKARRREFFKALQIHSAFGKGASDVFRWLSVIGAYEFEHNRGSGAMRKGNESAVERLCRENFVRPKAMEEIHKLREQMAHIVTSTFPETEKELNGAMKPPSEFQIKLLQQIITSGFIDQIAVRKDYIEKQTGVKRTSARGVAYQAIGVKEDVFIHPSSVLFGGPPPEFVAFQDVVRTSRVWLKVVTRVNPSWLPTLGPTLSTYSKPLKVTAAAKAGKIAVVPRFGPYEWELPMTTIDK